MKKLVVGIDFNNMIYGSYYGDKLINSKGVNVNAIQSFFFKLRNLRETLTPDYIVFCADVSRKNTFRRKLYSEYKNNRKPTDLDIINQMKYAQQMIALLGYPIFSNELYEADDLLGMISKFSTDMDMEMIIVSSDRDLYQLINDNVCIYSLRNKEIIDQNWLYQKYHINSDQWIDLKIIIGDRSDNIPGIEGIGEAGGLKLLYEFGSLNNVYNKLGYIRPVIRDKLIAAKDSIPLIKDLVTILTDYKLINLDLTMLSRKEVYPQEIFELLHELELNSLYNVMKYDLLS